MVAVEVAARRAAAAAASAGTPPAVAVACGATWTLRPPRRGPWGSMGAPARSGDRRQQSAAVDYSHCCCCSHPARATRRPRPPRRPRWSEPPQATRSLPATTACRTCRPPTRPPTHTGRCPSWRTARRRRHAWRSCGKACALGLRLRPRLWCWVAPCLLLLCVGLAGCRFSECRCCYDAMDPPTSPYKASSLLRKNRAN